MEFVIVTGCSGAGKSRALEMFEDAGFYCVDNLPTDLIPTFADLCLRAEDMYDKVALCADVRVGAHLDLLLPILKDIEKPGLTVRILFLEAAEETLLNRYKESRRRHPLQEDGMQLIDALHAEREKLETLKRAADYVVDTSVLSTNALREVLLHAFLDADEKESMAVSVFSFGYKHGVPKEADLVFDVRFLKNPYYIDALREQTGLMPAVRDFVLEAEDTSAYLQKLNDLIAYTLPRYRYEGKHTLTVAIGCTGGQHRSVVIAEALGANISAEGYYVRVTHRDMQRSKL